MKCSTSVCKFRYIIDRITRLKSCSKSPLTNLHGCAVKGVELERVPPRRAQSGVKLAEVEDLGVVLDEDEVLISAELLEDGSENLPEDEEYALGVPLLGAVVVALLEVLANACP